MKTIARKLRIKGRVQGVFFRDSMGAEAARLGVAGWVRNRSDGSVEAWVQGEADQVSKMIRWSRVGPSRARVDDVLIEEVELNFDLTSFERLETL